MLQTTSLDVPKTLTGIQKTARVSRLVVYKN